jgi:hypothetical protein
MYAVSNFTAVTLAFLNSDNICCVLKQKITKNYISENYLLTEFDGCVCLFFLISSLF